MYHEIYEWSNFLLKTSTLMLKYCLIRNSQPKSGKIEKSLLIFVHRDLFSKPLLCISQTKVICKQGRYFCFYFSRTNINISKGNPLMCSSWDYFFKYTQVAVSEEFESIVEYIWHSWFFVYVFFKEDETNPDIIYHSLNN